MFIFRRTIVLQQHLVLSLCSSTCFEHYYVHLQVDNCISAASGVVTIFLYMFRALLCSSSLGQLVLVQHLVSSLFLGDCSIHRLPESSRNLCTEQSPKEGDDTRCCVNTIILLKMSTVVLETCRGM